MSDPAPKQKQSKRPRSRGWRIFFGIFKWTRVAILLALLCLVILGLFLNRVGLPEWVQRRVVAQLKARGWDMQFSRMRLQWYRGIVADHLQLSRTNTMTGPNLFVETAEFRLNGRALRSFDLQADSVMLAGARLIWPLPDTNQPRQTFVLNKVRGELFFNPGDQWELRSFQAQMFGAQVRIRGDIANASLIRDWKLPRREPRDTREPERHFWHDFLTQADKVRALAPPGVTVVFALDARDLRSLDATAKIMAPAVESPWGAATNIFLTVRVVPPARSNDAVQAEIRFAADQPRTPWGAATNLLLTARLEPSLTELFPTNGALRLELGRPRTPWGEAGHLVLDAHTMPPATNPAARLTTLTLNAEQPRTNPGMARSARITVRFAHAATNLLPAFVQSETTLERAETRWATSAWARVEASLALPRADELLLSRTNLAWTGRLENIPFDLTVALSNALGARLEWPRLSLTNRWRWPEFSVAADAQSSAGTLAAEATLDADTRLATFRTVTRGDPHTLAPFLPTNALPWLAEYNFTAPLEARFAGRATLPAWTNPPSGWRTGVLSTVSLASEVELGAAAYHGVHFSAAQFAGFYTNSLWTLPRMRFTRPEGVVDASGEVDARTGRFRLKLTSTIDPQALRPLFSQEVQQDVFDLFGFTVLPVLAGEAHGNVRDLSTLSAMAAGAVTNVSYNREFFRYATATADYTNGFLSIYRAVVLRDGEQGGADGLGIDLPNQRLYFTNAHGNLTPMVMARAIGPHIVEVMEPYVFDVPPTVRADGSIPIGHSDKTEDLRFEVQGGTFHWWRIHADRVRASVHWLGEDLMITNVQARWRGADAGGWAHFDFRKPKGGGMEFHVAADRGDLSRLVQDLRQGLTNRLEGLVDMELTVTQAFANDLKSWNGFGQARLTNGLLWDVPLFGVASTLLNGIIPGLGHSRAKSATATFTITNSVLFSKDLKIEASAMHLKYRGTVDFDGNVDARMEAQMLKGVPGIGPLITVVLWPVTKLFEYRVTRTLDNPKLDEVYFIPKLLLLPFQPIKTLKSIFGRDDRKPSEPPPDRKPRTSPKATP